MASMDTANYIHKHVSIFSPFSTTTPIKYGDIDLSLDGAYGSPTSPRARHRGLCGPNVAGSSQVLTSMDSVIRASRLISYNLVSLYKVPVDRARAIGDASILLGVPVYSGIPSTIYGHKCTCASRKCLEPHLDMTIGHCDVSDAALSELGDKYRTYCIMKTGLLMPKHVFILGSRRRIINRPIAVNIAYVQISGEEYARRVALRNTTDHKAFYWRYPPGTKYYSSFDAVPSNVDIVFSPSGSGKSTYVRNKGESTWATALNTDPPARGFRIHLDCDHLLPWSGSAPTEPLRQYHISCIVLAIDIARQRGWSVVAYFNTSFVISEGLRRYKYIQPWTPNVAAYVSQFRSSHRPTPIMPISFGYAVSVAAKCSTFDQLIGMTPSEWKHYVRYLPSVQFLSAYGIPFDAELSEGLISGVKVQGVNVESSGHLLNAFLLYLTNGAKSAFFSDAADCIGCVSAFLRNFKRDQITFEPTFKGAWHHWIDIAIVPLSVMRAMKLITAVDPSRRIYKKKAMIVRLLFKKMLRSITVSGRMAPKILADRASDPRFL